jgi:hypothetical protein
MTEQKKKKKNPQHERKASELRQIAADIVGQPEPTEDDEDHSAETEARRAVVLAFSEQTQAALAADLTARALHLLGLHEDDAQAVRETAEQYADAQAETIAELASGPDLADFMPEQVEHDEHDQADDWEGGGDQTDDWEGGGDAY